MKRFLLIVLVLVLVAGAVFAQAARFNNGVQVTTAASYNPATSTNDGSITVAVTFRGNRITQIEVREHTDTAAFVTMVTNAVVPAIIAAQNTNVDNVTGATYTAKGVKDAVAAAMEQARRR